MRRSIRRTAAPYKSPRLFTMVALLVCLVLMMNSLRSMRGPGPNAEKIISNLDKSIKLVGTVNPPSENQQTENQQTENQQVEATSSAPLEPPKSEQVNPVQVNPEQGQAVPELSQPATEGSNVDDAPNLNLREDLELQDWLGPVNDNDGGLKLLKIEMPAYWRIVSVVNKTPFPALLKAADSKIRFSDLYNWAPKHRSKLYTMKVNIRKVNRYDPGDNPAGVDELFEVWCSSEKNMSWLYVFLTPELPPGLDADTPARQTATFAGYFFKLQGYQPGIAKPKPILAPMLIGKFELAKAAPNLANKPTSTLELIVAAIILVVGLTAILLRITVFSAKKPKLSRPAPKVNLDIFTDR